MDTFLRLLWRALCVGCCAGLSFVAIAQTCTPHQGTQYQFSTSGSVRNGTQRPSILSAWNESASASCNDIAGQYNTEFSFTNSVPPAYVVTSYSSTGSWDGTNCVIGGTKTTTSCNSNSNPVCGAPSTTSLSGNFTKATRVVQIDCTTCAGKSGLQSTSTFTTAWARIPGGSWLKTMTDAQYKANIVGPSYVPISGSTVCDNGCTATVGAPAGGNFSQTPSSTGLYRISTRYVVTGTGGTCSVGANDGNNPSAPPAACDGFAGSVNGKTQCVGPVGSVGGTGTVPDGALIGNPTSGSSGTGPISQYTPSNGNGGNGGGPPTTLDGQPIGSDSNGDGVADIGGSGTGTPSTDPCANNNLATGCYGTAPGQPSNLYTAKSRTFTQVFQQFQTTLSASGIGSGVANFFSVNFSASQCPTWTGHIAYIDADMNIDFMCSTPFQALLLAMRAVVLIVAGWAAFRIALY